MLKTYQSTFSRFIFVFFLCMKKRHDVPPILLGLKSVIICKGKNASMVLILDGNSEKRMHVRSNLCYLNCVRHSIRSRAVTNLIFFQERPIFLHAMCSKFWVTIQYKYYACIPLSFCEQ